MDKSPKKHLKEYSPKRRVLRTPRPCLSNHGIINNNPAAHRKKDIWKVCRCSDKCLTIAPKTEKSTADITVQHAVCKEIEADWNEDVILAIAQLGKVIKIGKIIIATYQTITTTKWETICN